MTNAYSAFISYSHADIEAANWLHHALESFRIPRGVKGPAGEELPRQLAPVFLDRFELAASADLDAHIEEALVRSSSLVVVCSPSAVASDRVTREIEHFVGRFGQGRVFTVIAGGRPNAAARGLDPALECFPAPLRSGPEVRADAIHRSEPLAADLRPGQGGRSEAVLKLMAGILGISLDRLRQRDLQRRRRRWIALTSASLAGAAIALMLALFAWHARGEALAAQAVAAREAATSKRVTNFLVAAFNVVRPQDRDPNLISARELLDRGVRELGTSLDEEPAVKARLLEVVGRVYRQLGMYAEARPLLAQSVTLRRSPTSEHLDAASSIRELMALDVAEDKFDSALSLLGEANRLLAGRDDPQALRLKADLLLLEGKTAIVQDRLDDANRVLAEALALDRRLSPEPGGERADILGSAGRSLREQGKFAEARPLLEEAVAIRRKMHPQGHVELAQAIRALSILHQEMADYDQYEMLARESLTMAELILGSESPELAGFVEVVANAYSTRDQYDEAIRLTRRVLALRTKGLGQAHTRAGYAHYNLGYMLGMQGHYKDALVHLNESQVIWERALGVDHPDVAYALDASSRFLRAQGRLAASEPLVLRALKINEAAFGPDHPNTARSVLNYGGWLRDSGRTREALVQFDRAERIRIAHFGADNARVKEVQEERALIGKTAVLVK